MTGFTLFDTAIGCCALGWTEAGIVDVNLPESSPDATRRRIAGRLAGSREQPPPAAVRQAVRRIAALFDGARDDLADIELDLSGVPDFHRDVYRVTRGIKPGRTLSYGAIATELGLPGAARAVGRALGHNPCPIIVPCHRVLAADGSMHGFSAHGGVAAKRRMLQAEGALPPDEPTLF
ncbi:MAG: methylated-DNA--[protein]-cysteine S-methyltransferase [Actinobacteria bacterium]|nr:methylated-DNA--[protein]-cysteine S-methyltransferase [Actinomycetota bacterium]